MKFNWHYVSAVTSFSPHRRLRLDCIELISMYLNAHCRVSKVNWWVMVVVNKHQYLLALSLHELVHCDNYEDLSCLTLL